MAVSLSLLKLVRQQFPSVTHRCMKIPVQPNVPCLTLICLTESDETRRSRSRCSGWFTSGETVILWVDNWSIMRFVALAAEGTAHCTSRNRGTYISAAKTAQSSVRVPLSRLSLLLKGTAYSFQLYLACNSRNLLHGVYFERVVFRRRENTRTLGVFLRGVWTLSTEKRSIESRLFAPFFFSFIFFT